MIHYLTLEKVIEIHDQLIEKYGGSKGVLNLSLLQSALAAPKASFSGKYIHRTIYDKTAAYLFHITKNHPFVDGNKRTATMAALLFFEINFKNGLFVCCESDYEELVLQVAQGLVSKKEIAKFFRDCHSIIKDQ